MMKRILISLTLLLAIATGVNAQNFLNRLRDRAVNAVTNTIENKVENAAQEATEEALSGKKSKKNNASDDEEADEEVDEEAKEATKSLGQILIDVISECDKQMLEIMQNASVDENAKKGAMTSLQEIKQNTIDNIEKVKKIQKSFDKKE